jgi:hypothetical protein
MEDEVVIHSSIGEVCTCRKCRIARGEKVRKEIKRSSVDKLLIDLLKRAEIINADPNYAKYIDRIEVFGSYITTDKEYLGDVDLFVEMSNRYNQAKIHKEMHIFGKGCPYTDSMSRLFWIMGRAEKDLKAKKNSFEFHPYEEKKLLNVPENQCRLLYERLSKE